MLPISDINYRNRFPVVNWVIILANIAVYLYEVVLSGNINLGDSSRQLQAFFYSWAVVPVEYTRGVDIGAPSPQPVFITLVTSMFIHGNLLHIGGNMLFLWIFGDNVESNMGHIKYLFFYFICGIVAGLAQILVSPFSIVPSLGASGAIAGVLAGYIVLYPRALVRTLLFIPPFFITVIRVYAFIYLGIWFLLQLWDGLAQVGAPETAQTGGVAFWAHIGGFLAGLLLIWVLRGRDTIPRPPRARGYRQRY